MKPAPFDYVRAETMEEAVSVLHEEGGDARILAGGQSLMPMLNMRLARPAVVVDIGHLKDRTEIACGRDSITVPAAARQRDLQALPGLVVKAPLLAASLPWVGHVQTRARGTVCGSMAHADPSAELPLCLVALGGAVVTRSKRARREVPAAEFFTGMMSTCLADDECIEAVRFPVSKPDTGCAFNEVGRRHGDFAIVACAVRVTDETVELTVGGVDDVPAKRVWPRLAGGDLDDALNAFAWELDARDDIHASARLRRDLVRSLGRRTIEEASACIA